VEAAGNLTLTITYAPLFHSPSTIDAIGRRFQELIAELAGAAPEAAGP
jgi:hypothetical protein